LLYLYTGHSSTNSDPCMPDDYCAKLRPAVSRLHQQNHCCDPISALGRVTCVTYGAHGRAVPSQDQEFMTFRSIQGLSTTLQPLNRSAQDCRVERFASIGLSDKSNLEQQHSLRNLRQATETLSLSKRGT
jgi:hypothetical protein